MEIKIKSDQATTSFGIVRANVIISHRNSRDIWEFTKHYQFKRTSAYLHKLFNYFGYLSLNP